MALVRKPRSRGDVRQLRLGLRKQPAGELYAQAARIFADGLSVKLAENSGKMQWVNADLRRDFIDGQVSVKFRAQ